MADLLSFFSTHLLYFPPLIIPSKLTIIIHPLFLSLHFFLKKADISIRALIRSERPTIVESDPQPTGSKMFSASGTQARASTPGRGLCRVPPQNNNN